MVVSIPFPSPNKERCTLKADLPLSKHQNKHERPYKCTISSCTRTQGFTSKSDQIRHERTVHKTLHGGIGMQGSTSNETLFFCDELNCKRGPGNENFGFTRKDNLMDHVRRRHGGVLASSRASLRRGEGASGATMLENQSLAASSPGERQMNSLVAVPGRQKRTATEVSGTLAEETNASKKLRQEDHGSYVDTERTPREKALTQEVEKLKKALEKEQEQNERLISIIDRLTQGPKWWDRVMSAFLVIFDGRTFRSHIVLVALGGL